MPNKSKVAKQPAFPKYQIAKNSFEKFLKSKLHI